MKPELFKPILTLTFLLLISYNPVYACSCPYEPVFCKAVRESRTIILGVVTDRQDFHLMQVERIENLRKEVPDDSITILGQDGLNCGAVLSDFNIQDTFVLALLQVEDVNDSLYWFLEGLCGLHHLRYEDGMVKGQITEDVTVLPLQHFKENLNECLDIEVSTTELEFDKLSLVPNPALNNIYISIEKHWISEAFVYNANGQEVLHEKEVGLTNHVELNTSALKRGIYFLKVRTAEGILSRKFLKI